MEGLDRDLDALLLEQLDHRRDATVVAEAEPAAFLEGEVLALLGGLAGRHGVGGEPVPLRPEGGLLEPGVVVEPVADLFDHHQVPLVHPVVGAEMPDRGSARGFEQAAGRRLAVQPGHPAELRGAHPAPSALDARHVQTADVERSGDLAP
jgi:hypothetical protein